MSVQGSPGEPVVTLAQLDGAKTEILAKLDETRRASRKWELGVILLQVGLPILLGLLVLRVQANVNRATADAATRLSIRLALSQEFYKERLAVYTKLHSLALAVKDSSRQARLFPSAHAALTENIARLWECYTSNSLYLSPEMLRLIGLLWSEAVDAARVPAGQGSTSRMRGLIEEIEKRMRVDLHVDDLAAPEGVFASQIPKAAK